MKWLSFIFFVLACVASAEDIYVVTTPNGQTHTYNYPASPPGPASQPVVSTANSDCGPEATDENGGWGCNFVSEDTFTGYVDEVRANTDKNINSYRDSLNAKLAAQDNPPAPGTVIPEDQSLVDRVNKALDNANLFLTKLETEEKARRQEFYVAAKQRELAAGDPRLKPGNFNRLLMATNPEMDRFSTFRVVNGVSLFPHGVTMPESRLWITGGEMLSMFRLAMDFSRAGMGLAIIEASLGRKLTPPFERLSQTEQKFLYGAIFISHRQAFLRQAEELGSLEAVFAKNLGADAVNTGALAGFKEILASSNSLWYYTPALRGPLSDLAAGAGTVAETFRSGTYIANLTSTEVKLYRTYGGSAGQLGPYFSRTKPTGPMQATIDVAIHPSWGSTSAHWVEITVPKNSLIFEGPSAAQKINGVEVLGGGSQVYVKGQIPNGWVTDGGSF